MSDPCAAHAEAIRTAVARPSRWLSEGAYDKFCNAFTADGEYLIRAYSPEIRSMTIWMKLTGPEIAEHLRRMADHVNDLGLRHYLTSVEEIELHGDSASAISSFVAFRIDAHGGTQPYATGFYLDALAYREAAWKISSRVVETKTRQLAAPIRLPL